METIRYSEWQALIRLPSYVMMAFVLDQNAKIHHSQIKILVNCLVSLNREDQQGIIAQIAIDALDDLPLHTESIHSAKFGNFQSGVADSISTARKVLNKDTYQQFTDLMSHLIDEMQQQQPIYYQIASACQLLVTGQASNNTRSVAWLLGQLSYQSD